MSDEQLDELQEELTIDFDIGYSIKVRRFGYLRGGAFYVTCLKAGTPALTCVCFTLSASCGTQNHRSPRC